MFRSHTSIDNNKITEKSEDGSIYTLLYHHLVSLVFFSDCPILHVRIVSTNHSDLSHRVKKWTNSVASRVVTPQECISSVIVSFRFASAGAVGS